MLPKSLNFLLAVLENIVGKKENAGYQYFFPFPMIFSKGFSLRVVKTQDCVVKRKTPHNISRLNSNKHLKVLHGNYKVPYRLHVFLEV